MQACIVKVRAKNVVRVITLLHMYEEQIISYDLAVCVCLGPDHVQVNWKHKSIGNQASDWLI